MPSILSFCGAGGRTPPGFFTPPGAAAPVRLEGGGGGDWMPGLAPGGLIGEGGSGGALGGLAGGGDTGGGEPLRLIGEGGRGVCRPPGVMSAVPFCGRF